MKANKGRLPAFTIMELTVTMLLSAIVIAMTYTAYSMMSQAYAGFSQKNDRMATIIRLDELLNKDFERAESITYQQDSLVFNSTGSQIRYHFAAGQVIRSSIISDTFKIQTTQPFFYNEQLPVGDEGNSTPVHLDELRLTILLNSQQLPYRYHKLYSSENLFKLNAHAIH